MNDATESKRINIEIWKSIQKEKAEENMKKKERVLISIKDACELTRYSAQHFYNLIYQEKLKTYGKRGGKVLLDKEEVLEVLGIQLSA